MQKKTLFYFYDVLCGWCYGFSPVFQQFLEKYGEEIELRVINGGMVRGERVGPIGEVAGYIANAYKDVEQRTGVKFGAGFLEGTMKEGTAIFDSEPLAQAHVAMVLQAPERSYEFAAALHRAVYVDGVAPRDGKGLRAMVEALGLDAQQWEKDWLSNKVMSLTHEQFQLTTQAGVKGFPTLVLANEQGKYISFANGALPFDMLEEQYGKAIEVIDRIEN